MPDVSTEQPSSLEEYVRGILEQHGFNTLSPQDQEAMFFDFMEQALIRLGANLSPLLDDEGKRNFKTLLDSNSVSQKEWAIFWEKYVPDFGTVMQKTLEDYSLEIKQAFVKSS